MPLCSLKRNEPHLNPAFASRLKRTVLIEKLVFTQLIFECSHATTSFMKKPTTIEPSDVNTAYLIVDLAPEFSVKSDPQKILTVTEIDSAPSSTSRLIL